jgi:hypothetical protein
VGVGAGRGVTTGVFATPALVLLTPPPPPQALAEVARRTIEPIRSVDFMRGYFNPQVKIFG